MKIDELKACLETQTFLDENQVAMAAREPYLMDADEYLAKFKSVLDYGDDIFSEDDVMDALFAQTQDGVLYYDLDEYGDRTEEWHFSGDDVEAAVAKTGAPQKIMGMLNQTYALQVAVEADGTAFAVPVMRNRETGAYCSVQSLKPEIEELLPSEVEVLIVGPERPSYNYYEPPSYDEKETTVSVSYDIENTLLQGYRGAEDYLGEMTAYVEQMMTAQERAEAAKVETVTVNLTNSSGYLRSRLEEECGEWANASSWTDGTKHSVRTEDIELIETILADANADYNVDLGLVAKTETNVKREQQGRD